MLHIAQMQNTRENVIPKLTGASHIIRSVLPTRSNGVTIMTTEDTSQMPLFSPEDEKEAQKVPDYPHKNGTLKVTNKWTGFQGKTLWDWLQLIATLAIPLILVGQLATA
jgi:hypothetical protein